MSNKDEVTNDDNRTSNAEHNESAEHLAQHEPSAERKEEANHPVVDQQVGQPGVDRPQVDTPEDTNKDTGEAVVLGGDTPILEHGILHELSLQERGNLSAQPISREVAQQIMNPVAGPTGPTGPVEHAPTEEDKH